MYLSIFGIMLCACRSSEELHLGDSNWKFFQVSYPVDTPTGCQDTRVTYIDNEHTFTAPSGAPRLALYQDLTHPSKQGTVRLSGNLAQGFGIWQHDNISQNQQHGANSHSEKRGNFPGAVHTITNMLDSDTPIPPLETVLHHPTITSLHYLHLKENVPLPFSISSL